jgi:carboxymethylenebutenolidase
MVFERTTYMPKPGAFDAVLATRHAACAIRREIGLPVGEIFVEEGSNGGPDVIHWECRFASDAEREHDLKIRAQSRDFIRIRKTMQSYISDFERRIFRHAARQATVLRDVSLDGVAIVPQEVSFEADGRTLKGYLYLPPGDGPFPCMVTNHGSSIHQGTSDVCRPGTAAVLMSWGVASFLPHRRGYGNSPGAAWREEVNAEYGTNEYDVQLEERLINESRDVIAALAMLESHPKIDAGHIGVMGSSFGGTVTLLAAANCPRFRCAVEFAGAAMNWERAPRLRQAMLQAAQQLTQPIYFMQAQNDYSVGPTLELAASLAGGDKICLSRVFPGFGLTKDEGHFLYGQGAAIWGDEVRRFLDQWL